MHTACVALDWTDLFGSIVKHGLDTRVAQSVAEHYVK